MALRKDGRPRKKDMISRFSRRHMLPLISRNKYEDSAMSRTRTIGRNSEQRQNVYIHHMRVPTFDVRTRNFLFFKAGTTELGELRDAAELARGESH